MFPLRRLAATGHGREGSSPFFRTTRLLKGVGESNQRRLAPGPSEERDPADRRVSSRACRQSPVRREPIWVSLTRATSRQPPRSARRPE